MKWNQWLRLKTHAWVWSPQQTFGNYSERNGKIGFGSSAGSNIYTVAFKNITVTLQIDSQPYIAASTNSEKARLW